jgi:hypothetical protein
MRVALAAHDEVLRHTIEAHGGWLFKHTNPWPPSLSCSTGSDATNRALSAPVKR